MKRHILIAFAAVALAGCLQAVIRASEDEGVPGVVVLLGVDGSAASRAVNYVKRGALVHCLVNDDAALKELRASLSSQGVYGLATAEKLSSLKSLPYVDNLINVLVVTAGGLGGNVPPEAELLRVVTPGGTLAVDGKTIVKPWPTGMDEWTHFDHSADGNGVSHDITIGEPTLVQWISQIQPTVLGGNPAAYKPSTGFRIAGGRAYYLWANGQAKIDKDIQHFLTARCAFNGVPLWNQLSPFGEFEWGLVADEHNVYTFAQKAGVPVCIDGKTGKTVKTFDQGLNCANSGFNSLRLIAGALVQTASTEIVALDLATGARKWEYKSLKGSLYGTIVAADANRVFTLLMSPSLYFGRWPSGKAAALICLDLESGKVAWESDAVAEKKVGQAIYYDGKVVLFGPAGIGALDKDPVFTGCVDAATGKLLWSQSYPGGGQYGQTWGLNAMVWDDALYYATPWNLFKADLKTGERKLFWGSGYNQRCNRCAATDKYFVMGLGTWVDTETGKADVLSVSRSGCAQGAALAEGLTYYTPNTCGCMTQIRGHVVVSSVHAPPPEPDDSRLQRDGATLLSTSVKAVSADTLLTREWKKLQTDPVILGGNSLVAVSNENRLECRDGNGKALWATVAGGRITAPPVVMGDQVYFGADDGYVYAINQKSGAEKWRFLAAPVDRRIVSNGGIESAWPVFGVVTHQGKICASAGYHPETGGIHIWGLEPASGKPAWHKVLTRKGIATAAGQTNIKIDSNRILNDVLKSDGDKLSLPGIVFSPSDSDPILQQKVDHPQSETKKK